MIECCLGFCRLGIGCKEVDFLGGVKLNRKGCSFDVACVVANAVVAVGVVVSAVVVVVVGNDDTVAVVVVVVVETKSIVGPWRVF